MKRYILVTVLFFSGCTSIQQVSAPNGIESYAITCSFNSLACYNEASTLCANGFDIKPNSNVSDSLLVIECANSDTNVIP